MDQEKHNINRHCDSCIEHGIVTMKLGQMCQWQQSHEVGTKKWRSRVEKDIATLEKEKILEHSMIRAEFKDAQSKLSRWAVANLTGVVMVLITLLLHLVFRNGVK